LPQVDAGLFVLGADPPITAEELVSQLDLLRTVVQGFQRPSGLSATSPVSSIMRPDVPTVHVDTRLAEVFQVVVSTRLFRAEGWGAATCTAATSGPPGPARTPDRMTGHACARSRLRHQLLCQTAAMFVIELVYKADLAEIDAHMKAHMAFLQKYYAAGNFLVSGRKIPRDGGIILAVGKDKQQLEAIVKKDPFHKHGFADFRIIEFRASQRADDIPKRVEG
jgi:uncharacterized protein YciI